MFKRHGVFSIPARKILCAILICIALPLSVNTIQPGKTLTLYDFSRPNDLEGWTCFSDQSRGGISNCTISSTAHETALFSGVLKKNLTRSFCLAYSPPDQFQLRSYGGLILRLKGDGKHYKLAIYTQPNIDGISYQAGFNTRKDRLATIFLPFNSFIPFLDQRVVRNWPVLDQSSIDHIGIMIADQPSGSFQLEIFWIKAKSR
jgi:NADH dehydrogenase [ubiquinone] 1 alpha subcomplex assembly factor 1